MIRRSRRFGHKMPNCRANPVAYAARKGTPYHDEDEDED
jgi:hypothetical protein